jgi:hypothetical protein
VTSSNRRTSVSVVHALPSNQDTPIACVGYARAITHIGDSWRDGSPLVIFHASAACAVSRLRQC